MTKRRVRARSAFQEHVVLPSNVVDFTERKLASLARSHKDEDVRKTATKLLHDYLMGLIAIAWEDGVAPVYSFIERPRR